MSQSIDLGNTDVINFNSNDVEVLLLNGNEIWSITDELILNVSSVKFSDTDSAGNLITNKYYLVFNIKAIRDTTVSFNDFTTTVLAGENQKIYACNAEDTIKTGDLIITGKCEFSSTHIDYNTDETARFIPMELNGISKWNEKLDYIPFGAFCYVIGVDTNVVVPNNIKTIDTLAFGGETRVTLGNYTSVKTYSPFSNVVISLPDSLEKYYYNSFGDTFNTTYSGGMRFIDGYCIYGKGAPNECVVPDGTRGFPTFTTAVYDNEFVWPTTMTKIVLNSDGALKTIQKSAFGSTLLGLTEIEIPSSVIKLCDDALGASKLTKYLFHTLPDANIEFGTSVFGGSGKTAKSITVFTDNEIVKNYALNAENINAEVYPTYMYGWSKLAQPTITLDGSTLTISAVENATAYEIYYAEIIDPDNPLSGIGEYNLLKTTNNVTVDLSEIYSSTAYMIYVIAIAENYIPSEKSATVRLQISKLNTPIVSLDGTILTITPVENATHYIIGEPSLIGNGLINEILETSDLIVDLTAYQGLISLNLAVRAVDSTGTYCLSDKSETITLPGTGTT